MKLQANRNLVGEDYRRTRAGELFDVIDPLQAKFLLETGQARIPEPPRVTYHTKVVQAGSPPLPYDTKEGGSGRPFRDVHHADEGSAPVPAAGDTLLPSPDMGAERTANIGRRIARSRGDATE